MKKIAVVYWSGGGNTEAMAQAAVDEFPHPGAGLPVATFL